MSNIWFNDQMIELIIYIEINHTNWSTSWSIITLFTIVNNNNKSTDPNTKSIEPNIAIKSPKLISLHI